MQKNVAQIRVHKPRSIVFVNPSAIKTKVAGKLIDDTEQI